MTTTNPSIILSTTQFINSFTVSGEVKMYSKIIFIDPQVENYQRLVEGVVPEAIVVILDATQNGIKQITQSLACHQFSEVHIVSHGAPGCLSLGNSQLNLDTLEQYSRELSNWLADSILLYGCNVAAGDAGAEFIEKLNKLTGAAIAASTTKIGHAAKGGNWELDVKTSKFEAVLAFNSEVKNQWNHVLNDTDGDGVNNDTDLDSDNDGILDTEEGFSQETFTFVGRPTELNGATITSLEQLSVNDELTISNVGTKNGTDIDARITITSISNAVEYDPSTGEITLRPYDSSQDDHFTFTIDFVESGTTTAVLLNGLQGTFKDIDSRPDTDLTEVVGFQSVNSFVLGSNLQSGGYENGQGPDGYTNFRLNPASNGNTSDWNDEDNSSTDDINHWVTAEFGTTSTLNIAFGVTGSQDNLNSGRDLLLDGSFRIDTSPDTDNDGIPNYLDLDSDNDGIPDNIEAQTTQDYIAPNADDAATYTTNQGLNSAYVPTNGLDPVNTDGTDEVDYLDIDSDNDGINDITESGLGLTDDGNGMTTGTVGDNGLDNAVEAADDYTDISGNAHDGTNFTLADTDNDTADDGSDAAPTETDLDYRDDVVANTDPVATDNSGATTKDGSTPATGNVIADNDDGNGVDTDADSGDILSITDVDGTAIATNTAITGTYGTLTISDDGTYTYNVDTNNATVQALGGSDTVTDTFTYTVDDGNAGTDTADLTITVSGSNNPPVATDNSNSVDEDAATAVTGNVITDNDDSNGIDSDPNSDTLGVTDVDSTAITTNTPVTGTLGTLTISDDGSYSYEVDNTNPAVQALGVGETATETFTYTVDDGNGGTDTADLVITVNGVNDDPTATDNSGATTKDGATPATGNVITDDDDGNGVDEDVDGDTLNITDVDGTAIATNTAITGTYGTLTISDDGTYTYNVDTNNTDVQALGDSDTVTDTFTYTVDDGNAGTDTADLTITVSGSNNPPVATDNSNSIDEDAVTPTTGNVISDDDGNAIDSDPNSDTLGVTDVDGTAITTNTPVTGTLGTLTISDDGSYSYEVDNTNPAVQALGVGETATETFTYTVDDGNGGTDTADLVITVNGVNDDPTATDNSGATTKDGATPATGNVITDDDDGNGVDEDVDGDTLNITDVDGTAIATNTAITGTYGTLTISDDGTYTYNVDTNNATVQALGDSDTLTETFTYTVNDGNSGTDTADLTITVSGSNNPPVATDNSNSIDEDAATAVTGNVISDDDGNGIDSDPNGDTPTVTEVNGEVLEGATTIDGTFGTLTISPDGSYSYEVDTTDPTVQALGTGETETETFTYTIDDGNGLTDAAELVITINGTNDAPVANDDNETTPEDTPVTIDVDNNDTDPEDGTPTGGITLVDEPTNGTVAIDDNGTPDDKSDDQVVYTPNEDFVGEDTFTYTVTDSEGVTSEPATVTVTVEEVNDEPVAVDDAETTDEETPVTIDVVENDTDIEDGTPTGEISIVEEPTNGTVAIDDNGTPDDKSDDQVVYTPDENFVGEDTFTYTVTDSEGVTSNPATVTVTVDPVNDTPVANDDGATTDEDTPVTIDIRENDTDVEDEVPTGEITITSEPENGTVEIDQNGTPDDKSDDQVIYTPSTDFVGTDTFTYTINDSDGTPSNEAEVIVSVGGVNDQPVAEDDVVTTPEDTPVTVDVSDNDTDTEDVTPTGEITIINQPENGTVEIDDNGTPDDFSDDQVIYTPDENYNGEDTFTYTIDDSESKPSNTATVTVSIDPAVNDAPIANDYNEVTPEDTPVTLDVVKNDTDVEDGVPTGVISIIDQPTNGTVEIDDKGTSETSDDEVVYTPDPDFNGTDTFTYTVEDSEGTPSELATVTVNVESINDTPVAEDDAVTTPENTPVTIDVDENDTDVEDGIPTGVISIIDQPTNGTVEIDDKGTPETSDDEVVYTPNSEFNGTDTFTYTIEDSEGLPSSVATVTVTVDDPGNPIAEDDGTTTPAETPVTINIVENDTDDGEVLPESVAIVDNPGNGTVTVNEDGTVEYTPNDDFVGEDTFTYTVTDDEGNVSEPATVTVLVQDPTQDTDEDGILDAVDLDDDNDGIPDEVEGDGDTDGDGVPDIVDLDSDNDGISDLDESGLTPEEIAELDTNNDGVIDPENEFGDNGLVDDVETTPDSGELDQEPVDTDSDNVPDFQDLDSDNDGLNDIIEAGLDDPEGDGVVNGSDSDGDGVPDAVDATDGFGDENPAEPDTDADNVPDYRDLDSDNDGVSDLIEGGLDPEVVDPDGNGIIEAGDRDEDGIPDPVDGSDGFSDDGNEPTPDADNDGTPDYQELDSDGDGTPDRVEAGLPTGEGTPDVDGDGEIDDPTDSDGDGVPDAIDSAPGTDGGFESTDTDKDGIPDGVDLDDDNDGILDELEGDGDTDGDGVPDIIDLDSDNDGIADIVESGLTPSQIAELDTDGDGVIDPSNSFGNNGLADVVETNPDSGELDLDGDGIADNPVDTDGDQVPDFQDLDSDNDGLNDITEAGNPDIDGNGIIDDLTDTDGDGLADAVDPDNGGIFTTPVDADGDNAPDFRDLDSDNDGINDILEGGLADPDGDGVVNGSDNDGDGILDQADPNDNSFGDNGVGAAPDTDNDGTPDYQDLDSDNDGENDIIEAGLADPEGDGVVNGPDSDGDGIPDAVDQNNNGFGDTPSGEIPDSDGDGVPDFRDVGVAPIAQDDSITSLTDAQVTIAVLANDTDADGDALSIASFNGTTFLGGTVSQNGNSLIYTPVAGLSGIDTFSYTITDGNGGTDTATVTVTIENGQVVAANNSPVANDDNPITQPDTAVTINVLQNDFDPDGDSFSLNQFDQTSNNGGTITFDGNQLVYTPPVGFEGTDTFSYTIIDSQGQVGTAIVTVSVEPEATTVVETHRCPPAPVLDAITLPEEPALAASLLPEPPDASNANIVGTDFEDILEGTVEADLINAGAGDDLTLAFGSNDTLLAGAGDDFGFAGQGDDVFFGDTGNDLLWGDFGADTLIGGPSGTEPIGDAGEQDTLYGNFGNDWLAGSLGQDILHGGQDNDRLHGGKDNDQVLGELGNDTLLGEQGDDTLLGGTTNATNQDVNGRDLLLAGAGDDFLDGNQGNDTLIAGEGNDDVHGGKDDDLLYGNTGDDTLWGELGNDTLIGGPSGAEPLGETGDQDLLYGLDGNDWLAGNLGRDTLYSGDGNDRAHGGKDDDWVIGELGNDTLVGEEGNDTLIGGTNNDANDPERDFNGADLLFGEGGNDWMEGSEANDTLVGGGGDDTLYGGQDDDLLHGSAGNDLMLGDQGNDTLCGGEGNDTLIGGLGNNILFGDGGSDVFVLNAESGVNIISDFQVFQDQLQIDGIDFNQLEIVQDGNNTTISFNSQLLVTLEQVNVDELTSDSFN